MLAPRGLLDNGPKNVHDGNNDGIANDSRVMKIVWNGSRLGRVLTVCLFLSSLFAWGGRNLLDDPGFERYHYDGNLGWYVPNPDAVWTEYGFGQGSVRFDASGWTAPADMVQERPLGFTPGGGGFTGQAPAQNRGTLFFRQDITDPAKMPWGSEYEAWVWLGGAGRDDDQIGQRDLKEERGGWRIFWYANSDPSTWREDNPLQFHHAELEHTGPANSFIRVYGAGLIPTFARGLRFEVYGYSWTGDLPSFDVNTRVALDNAYYGLTNPNLTRNGNFEEDPNVGDFVHWTHPDPWFGVPDTLPAEGQLMPLGFEYLLPFKPRQRCYGYYAYLQGWLDGTFSFGQQVNISSYPSGSEFAFSFYWHQNTTSANGQMGHILRRPMGTVHVGLECLTAASAVLSSERHTIVWPVSGNPNNTSPFDTNDNIAYNHRIPIRPPSGTHSIGLHVMLETNAHPWVDGALFLQAVDDFFLRVVSTPIPTATPTPKPVLLDLR